MKWAAFHAPPLSNGAIGYILETGAPERNLPARPFLVPGVRAALPEIRKGMHKAVVAALSGKPGDIDKGLDEAGLMAVASVQQTMIAGGFVPLSDRTIETRARRRYPDTGKLVNSKSSRDARAFLKLSECCKGPLGSSGGLFVTATHVCHSQSQSCYTSRRQAAYHHNQSGIHHNTKKTKKLPPLRTLTTLVVMIMGI